MSTVIIIGGGGFLARHIGKRFQKEGWRVVMVGPGAAGASSDASYAWRLPHPEFAKLLEFEKPALCVCGAGRASVPASMIEPLADFEASALLAFSILDDIRRASPETGYIHLSSAAVYGEPSGLPVSEKAQVMPISPYGWHKRFTEQVLEEHSKLFGLKTASLRIFSAYGAGLRRQVVWELAARAVTSAGNALTIRGNSSDSRDFVHGSDVASAVALVAERGAMQGEAYNLASGVETPIGDLALLIQRLLCVEQQVEFENTRPVGVPSRWHADIGKLAALGFSPEISLERGVSEVVEAAKLAHA